MIVTVIRNGETLYLRPQLINPGGPDAYGVPCVATHSSDPSELGRAIMECARNAVIADPKEAEKDLMSLTRYKKIKPFMKESEIVLVDDRKGPVTYWATKFVSDRVGHQYVQGPSDSLDHDATEIGRKVLEALSICTRAAV